MTRISKLLKMFAADDSGATAIEYGLIAALVSIVLITFLISVGGGLTDLFTYINGCMVLSSNNC